MQVAVVILNWNGKPFLEKFLPSVVTHSGDATIYVADNASTDDSVGFVQVNYPEIKIIETGGNLGYAGGYNKALEQLGEDVFVLLNSDVEVTENWIDPIVDLMRKDEQIAACQPKILQYGRKTHFEYAGACGGFIDRLGFPFCRGRMFDTLEEDNGQYDHATEVFWATGACLFVRRSVFEEIGGLDTDFFAHMEEIDFCWRMHRSGYKVMVEPHSVVYHVGGGTLSKSNPKKTFLNFRNGLELLLKNLPKNRLITTMFVRMVLDGVASIKFLLAGSFADFWAVFKAHMSFYSRFSNTLGKRKGSYPELKGIYQGSIVKAYFLSEKKRFSDLSDNF